MTESSFGSVRSVTNLKYAVSILKEYIIHWQVQKQALTKEREVTENLEPKQTEQTHTITVNDDEEEERDVLLRLMLSRSEKKAKAPRLKLSSSDSEPGVAPPPKRQPKKRAKPRCSRCRELKKGHICKFGQKTKGQKVAMV